MQISNHNFIEFAFNVHRSGNKPIDYGHRLLISLSWTNGHNKAEYGRVYRIV